MPVRLRTTKRVPLRPIRVFRPFDRVKELLEQTGVENVVCVEIFAFWNGDIFVFVFGNGPRRRAGSHR